MNLASIPPVWFDPSISIVGVILQLAAIVAGIWLIHKQVKRNHQSSLALQKKNFQEELRIKIFNKISESIESASSAVGSSSIRVQGVPSTIELFWIQRNQYNFNISPFKERANNISTSHYQAQHLVLRLTLTLEYHEIAIPSFRIFMKMINHQIGVCDKVFNKFFSEVLLYLPIDVTDKKQKILGTDVLDPIAPVPEKLKELKSLANKYLEECIALQSYIIDLSIEAQNTLLGSLFDNRIPVRKPEDPQYLVITTDPKTVQKLENYLAKKDQFRKKLSQ